MCGTASWVKKSTRCEDEWSGWLYECKDQIFVGFSRFVVHVACKHLHFVMVGRGERSRSPGGCGGLGENHGVGIPPTGQGKFLARRFEVQLEWL